MIRVLTFASRFAGLIANGSKTTTIRSRRSPIKVGEPLELIEEDGPQGMRRITEEPLVCTLCQPICFYREGAWTVVELAGQRQVLVEIRALALADGFGSVVEFLRYFERNYAFPFEGYLIKWAPLQQLQEGGK